jgi:urea carboxylase
MGYGVAMRTRSYRHMSAEERETLSLGLARGHSLRAMAAVLRRAPSTVSREHARNAMRAFGLKHTARALALQNQVPLLPGTGLLDNVEQALCEAAQIGYPLMLKSTAAAGGIGMRLCWNRDELTGAFESVKYLAQNNFQDAGLFLEKYVENARHIEVQIFGDGKGGVIALGERDCSVQRRNQKVIEETPAPNLIPHLRQALLDTAVRLGWAVNYRSAGTVEYIFDASRRVLFPRSEYASAG